MDRDAKLSKAFRDLLEQFGVNCVRMPPRSPNLTQHIERFIRSVKEESLHRMIFFGKKPSRTTVFQFLDHYHEDRNHQGLDNTIIEPGGEICRSKGDVCCRERLGGLLRYYDRDAG